MFLLVPRDTCFSCIGPTSKEGQVVLGTRMRRHCLVPILPLIREEKWARKGRREGERKRVSFFHPMVPRASCSFFTAKGRRTLRWLRPKNPDTAEKRTAHAHDVTISRGGHRRQSSSAREAMIHRRHNFSPNVRTYNAYSKSWKKNCDCGN